MDTPAFLHPFARPAATDFVSIAGGEGAVVWDTDGRRYVDAMASLWYCNVGHGRREIIDAVTRQMEQLDAFHAFELFTNPVADRLAEELRLLAPGAGFRVFLCSGGSEAVDSAIKIARAAHAVAGRPERRVVVSRAPSYHGVTYGALAATGLPDNQRHFGAMLPDVVQVPHDDLAAVDAVMRARAGEVAAVVAEPVVGAGGVHPPGPGYLEGLRELCDEHGAWLVLDEVISGFGRLGRWWGAEHYGVRPDLVTFAKAVTSGYVPLGGVLVGPAPRASLEADPGFLLRHGYTYSGHPLACAAALANIAVLREERLAERAPVIGGRLSAGLHELRTEGLVAEVRGDGAMWAAGMPEGVSAVAVRDAMLEAGVIPRAIGRATVSFCPPLVIEDAEVDRCLETLADALRTVGRQPVA